MKWQKIGHEYDELAVKICEENIKYYIWGEGVLGNSFFNDFSKKIEIVGFIDSNPDKQGRREDGVYIYSPEEVVLQSDERVLIATGWVKSVSEALESKGYKRHRDYFLIDEFSTIYMLYKYNKLYLEKMDMICNTKCTLRCKHCAFLVPYQKNSKNETFDEMKRSADLLFQWIDYVHVFAFSGGDAMLNPDLKRFITYIGNTYKGKKIQDFELYTNAIIRPDEEMLKLWKDYDIIVRFTDYSKSIPGRQKIEQMKKILDENHLRYDHVQFDNWVDTGYPQASNGIMGEEHLIEHCKKCSPVICTCLYQGKIYYCSPACGADISDLYEHDTDDAFTLENYHPDRKKEFMEFYTGYSMKGYPSHCTRCNGLFNINNKYVEAGEQL